MFVFSKIDMFARNTNYSAVGQYDPLCEGRLDRSAKNDGTPPVKSSNRTRLNSEYSVAIGGENDVTKHMESEQNRRTSVVSAARKSLTEYYGKR